MNKNTILLAAIIALATSTTTFSITSGSSVGHTNVGNSVKNSHAKKQKVLENQNQYIVVEEEEIIMIPVTEGKEIKQVATTKTTPKTIHKPFVPNGSLSFTQTFYGNSGKYKTATAHPSIALDYNFAPKWTLNAEWDRLMNMYDYTGQWYQSNNNYSSPQAELNYNYGNLGSTKIDWSSSLGIRQYNYFNSPGNQIWTWFNTTFDFHQYLPTYGDWQFTQFAIMPMYTYGWYPTPDDNARGHLNSWSIGLLTQLQMPFGFSLQADFFYFRDYYDGDWAISNYNGKQFENASYFGMFAWLEYSKELYKFSKNLNLTFNFAGGFDPYVSCNKDASAWAAPFWMSAQSYEWLSPTYTAPGNTKNLWTVFALPQLQLNYTYSEDINMSAFVQIKYSNQVWGNTEKDWRVQPQGGKNL
jgi:hypothetical protein